MAITPTLIANDPGSSLAALLRDGVAALGTSINNSIAVGRDRATLQLNQEQNFFNQMLNQQNLRQRRAENTRRALETDRLFGFNKERAARTDFVADRAHKTNVAESNRDYAFRLTEADRRAADAAEANKDRDASRSILEKNSESNNKLDAARLLAIQEEQKQTDLLRERQDTLRNEARGNTTYDALTTPGGAATLPDTDLQRHIDLFGPVTSPDIAGTVAAARRELQTRQPGVDAETGKVIPQRFAADKNNPYARATTPQEVAVITANLKTQLTEIDGLIKQSKPNSPALRALIETKDEIIKQMNAGGVAINEDGSSPLTDAATQYYPPKK